MIKRGLFGLALFFVLFTNLKAQELEKKITAQPVVHFRTFWMDTRYPSGDFKEDYALGMALNLGTKVQLGEKWKFHLGYRLIGNLASSDLNSPDPITGQSNRYELGLFDLQNPEDRFFGKLETFFLDYSGKRLGFKAGRMGINTDWINAQDGRLAPTAVEGVSLWFAPDKNWKFTAWAITRMNIRGGSEWLGVGETVGIFPQGRGIEGKPGKYYQNTHSDWLGIWEVDRKLGSKGKLHFSNTIAQNLFSTYWLGLESFQTIKKQTVFWGVQTGFQHGLGTGGNSESEYQYKDPQDRNYSISGRLGWKNASWTGHLSLTKVGGKGRWLSPREWGKDAWYTFIPRERNEGYESLTALVGYGEYRFSKVPLQIYAHAGLHWLPDTKDALANKYNFPSYRQFNLGIKYQPKWIENLDMHLIWVNKEPLKNQDLSPGQIYNKVEMNHFNAILNWRWN